MAPESGSRSSAKIVMQALDKRMRPQSLLGLQHTARLSSYAHQCSQGCAKLAELRVLGDAVGGAYPNSTRLTDCALTIVAGP
jgi:hypothetical protein